MRALQCIVFSLLLASRDVFAAYTLNLTSGVTPISHDIFQLHMTIFWICVAIGIIVFGVMGYSIFYHRKSIHPTPAKFHEHPGLEITWTIIPFLILVVVAIPATRVLLHINDPSGSDLTIKITGYQWKWRYEYLDQGINFFSNMSTPMTEVQGKVPKNSDYLQQVDKPLVVPIHKKIRLLVTGNDVIHSWWVPAFGVKQDAVPGFINETWTRVNRPGLYLGHCAELCGINHAYMPIVVKAVTEKEFADWVTHQQTGISSAVATQAPMSIQPSVAAAPAQTQERTATTPAPTPPIATSSAKPQVAPAVSTVSPGATPGKLGKDELMKKGEAIYMSTCSACHMPDGAGMPPTFPALKESPIVKGPVAAHINRILNGKPGTAMQAFRDQFNDEDIAAVATYERNALGNNLGDLVQPEQIKAAKALPPLP